MSEYVLVCLSIVSTFINSTILARFSYNLARISYSLVNEKLGNFSFQLQDKQYFSLTTCKTVRISVPCSHLVSKRGNTYIVDFNLNSGINRYCDFDHVIFTLPGPFSLLGKKKRKKAWVIYFLLLLLKIFKEA